MAKKKATPTAQGKAAQAKPAPQKGKKVSVKKIVAEIDRTLKKLEPVKAAAQAKGGTAKSVESYAIERAMMSLRGARDVVEGICVPGFDIPF